LVTSYVINAYLCLAMLHAWTLEYQHMLLCVWRWNLWRQKANGQLEKITGSSSQRLAQQGPEGCQLQLSTLWRSEIAKGHGAVHRFTRTTRRRRWWWRMTCQKRRVKLIFQGTDRLSGTGIVAYLKIINVECNLKQFDVEADRICIENADDIEIPFSAKIDTCAYITELSYGSVANITFSPNANDIVGTKTKNKTNEKIHFRPKTKKAENDQIAHFWRRKRKRISVAF